MFETKELVRALDGANARVARAQRRHLSLIAQVDRTRAWRGSGARDFAHWLSMRYGISLWKALRWIAAAHALQGLPEIADAFSRGRLGLDKVVELCRFAAPETEEGLVDWAEDVSCASVSRRGDAEVQASADEIVEAEEARRLSWWYVDEGRRVGLEAELPAAQGAVVVRAIERMAERVPPMPGEEGADSAATRRADALVAICAARIAADPDPDRATVVVHAQVDGNGTLIRSELEGGTPIHRQAAGRLLCDSRVQTVIEDPAGTVLDLGRMTREPSAALMRQIRYRDRGCRFPGCGTRSFTQAHHMVWWRHGGRTDLNNLLLICSFHHRLVHEHGWSIERAADGAVEWRQPDGARYRAGPLPEPELLAPG